MIQRRKLVAAALLACSLIGTASAQSGRFTMVAVEEGALRLDSQTGAISLCSRKEIGWTCQALADDGAAYQREIERLLEENRALKKQIDEASARLAEKADPPAPKPPEPERDQAPLRVPTDEDIDNLMAFFDKMMRRFQDAIESIKPNPSRSL